MGGIYCGIPGEIRSKTSILYVIRKTQVGDVAIIPGKSFHGLPWVHRL